MDPEFLSLQNLRGCNAYVDSEAEVELRRRLLPYGPEGIHFLDNGNYHYATRYFIEKIEEPFELLVFDHHDDGAPPAFEGMRSCGSWLLDAAEDIGCKLKQSVNIEDSGRISIRPHGGQCIRTEVPGGLRAEGAAEFLQGLFGGFPLYISIDKDILSEETCDVNWDQGDLALDELIRLCGFFREARLIGVDICGGADSSGGLFSAESLRKNEAVDLSLLEYFLKRAAS